MAMPADRKSASRRSADASAPVDNSASAASSASAAAASSAAEEPVAEPVAEDAEPEAVPLNRAERRGQAKRGGRPDAPGRGKVAGRTGPVQGPRMWSNRRGGG
jgi:hypothetical protein